MSPTVLWVLQLRNLQMCEQSSQKLTCHKFPVLTLPISSPTKLQVYYTEAQKPSCQAESKMELTSAVKVTLLAFAAKRRTAAPLLPVARRSPLSTISCHTALSSKPAARCGRMM